MPRASKAARKASARSRPNWGVEVTSKLCSMGIFRRTVNRAANLTDCRQRGNVAKGLAGVSIRRGGRKRAFATPMRFAHSYHALKMLSCRGESFIRPSTKRTRNALQAKRMEGNFRYPPCFQRLANVEKKLGVPIRRLAG